MFLFFILVIFLALLLVSKVRYFVALILRQDIVGLNVKKDYSYQPSVSVLIPCYNEGRTVYDTIEAAIKSNYPPDKLEIVAFDDASTDDSYEWLLKAQQDFPNVIIGKNAVNSKKPQTICNAFEKCHGEICIEVDSDSILERNAIREVAACFVGEKTLGAVGAVVNVRNTNTNILTSAQTLAYFLQFHFIKPLENWSRTVACISGAMLAIRRDLLAKFDPVIRGRRWFGIPVNEGEDRFVTQLVLMEGFGTYVDLQASCGTEVPDTFNKLFRQQLRWYRGSVRIFFHMLRLAPSQIHKLHPSALYSIFAAGFASLATLVLVGCGLMNGHAYWLAPLALIGVAGLVAIFDIITRIWFPEIVVTNPLKLVLYGVWWVASMLLTIAAVGTLDLGADWGTRPSQKIGE